MMAYRTFVAAAILSIASLSTAGVIDFGTFVQQAGGDAQAAYNNLMNGETPVLIKFWMDGCSHCKQIKPVIERIAAQFEGRLLVVEVRYASYRQLTESQGVSRFPTIVFLGSGKESGRTTGFKNEDTIKQLLNQYFGI